MSEREPGSRAGAPPAQRARRRLQWKRGAGWVRNLDRLVGIPLVLALGALRRRRRPFPGVVRRIGVIRMPTIGDTVLLSGVLKDLREAYPDAELVFFADAHNADSARLLPAVDRVVVLDLLRPWYSVSRLREFRADVVLDFGGWTRSTALLAALSGARFTAGFRTAGQWRHFVFDCVVDYLATRHELDNLRALVSALGVRTGSAPELIYRRCALPDPLAGLERYVVFHPWPGGSRKRLKEWPIEHWIRLASWLKERGVAAVVTGGPADREPAEALVRACREAVPGLEVVSAAGVCTLEQCCNLLEGAEAVVSVDTGIMHLAAAIGARVIGLHGPTAAARWGPVGPRAIGIDSDCPGCGYIHLGFERPRRPPPCMESLSVEKVIAALEATESAAEGVGGAAERGLAARR